MGTHWIERALLAVGLVCAGAAGCGLFDAEDAPTDGEVCEVGEDCTTGVCTSSALCSHSACDCPSGHCAEAGEVTSDCLDGWRCVGYDSLFDPVTEFFGGKVNEHNGYCQPACEGGCPDHYLCGSDGEFCEPDSAWAYPVPTVVWSGDASGELSGRDQMTTVVVEEGSTITLSGTGSSPRGDAIVGYSWVTVSGAADYLELEGQTIETTVVSGDYRRVELTITDDAARTGMLTVIFEACYGPGTTCGFEGSGCCSSCDDASNTCL
jgi:hypothetical protein